MISINLMLVAFNAIMAYRCAECRDTVSLVLYTAAGGFNAGLAVAIAVYKMEMG